MRQWLALGKAAHEVPAWWLRIGTFLLCLVLTTTAYARLNMTLLRAESGYWQNLSALEPPQRTLAARKFFTDGYAGHYTPVAFWAELKFTQLAKFNEDVWRWRQMLVLAGIATVIVLAVRRAGEAIRVDQVRASLAGLLLAAALICQPGMLEMLAWPFMIFQLLWALVSLGALLAFLRTMAQPSQIRWVWIAAGLGYGSMHLSGLGLATASAVIMTLVLLFFARTRRLLPYLEISARQLLAALLVVLLLTAIHAAAMLLLLPPSAATSVPSPPLSRPLAFSLGLIPMQFVAVARSVFFVTPIADTVIDVLPTFWPLGGALLLLCALRLFQLYGTAMRSDRPRALTVLILHLFSVVSFLGIVALIVAREIRQPSGYGAVGFLIGSRYLVPISFTLAGSAAVLILGVSRRLRLPALGATTLIVLVAALFANRSYRKDGYPLLLPRNQISHTRAWDLIVEGARQAHAAGLPLPDVPLGTLTQEFHTFRLSTYKPLLWRSLHLQTHENIEFAPWEEVRGPSWTIYKAAAPEWARLRSVLQLEDSPAVKH